MDKQCVHQIPSVVCGFDGSHCNGGCGCYQEKKLTNADRIRNMTDEELAEWVSERDGDYFYRGFQTDELILKWLQSEVKERGRMTDYERHISFGN